MSLQGIKIELTETPNLRTLYYASCIVILEKSEYNPATIRPDQKVFVICEQGANETKPDGYDVTFVPSLQEVFAILKSLASTIEKPKLFIGKLSPTLNMDELMEIFPYREQGK